MSLIEQLVKFYYEEPWHETRMSMDDVYQYYRDMMNEGRIIIHMENDAVIGYCEYALVTLEMLGALVLANSISPDFHNPKGKIIYVIGVYIPERYRGLGILTELKRKLIEINPDAQFLTGETQGKHRKSWAVYRLNREGIIHG